MKRPNNSRNLDMAIRRITKSEKEFVRYRTTMANVVVAQMLPNGVVKGGTALKIRFGNAETRFTTDLDTARAEDTVAFVEELDSRLAQGWEGFTGRVVTRKPATPKSVPPQYVMQPFDIKMSYIGRSWCTVQLEVGHNEIGDADEAERFMSRDIANMFLTLGFPEPGPIPLMPLRHQIAQKLHGLSEPGSGRVHDLVDLQLIMRDESIDLAEVRSTCERLFSYRQAHGWPCSINAASDWASIYGEASDGLTVIQDVDEAVAWANALVRKIEGA